MEKQSNGAEQPKFVPGSAASFETDFLNAKGVEIATAMSKMGDFVFCRSGSEGEGRVYFEGERDDGTKIRIIIEKGKDYKSPAEIVQEEKEAEGAN